MCPPLIEILLSEPVIEIVEHPSKLVGVTDGVLVTDRPVVALVSNEIAVLETPQNGADGISLDVGALGDLDGRKRLVAMLEEKAEDSLPDRRRLQSRTRRSRWAYVSVLSSLS